jgi:hypothetical protein
VGLNEANPVRSLASLRTKIEDPIDFGIRLQPVLLQATGRSERFLPVLDPAIEEEE